MEEVRGAEALGPRPVAGDQRQPEDGLVNGLPEAEVGEAFRAYAAFAFALASIEELSLLSTGALLWGFWTSSAPPIRTKGP